MSAVPADWRQAPPWRAALPAWGLLVAAVVLLYRETAAVMVGIWWRSETFAHCLLVLPITLWLVWRQRARLATLAPRPQAWALVALLAAAAAWLASHLVVVNAATQFAFVAMLVLTVPAVLGNEVARTILFPLLFLFFGVPFGEFVLPVMMDWTANFTVSALQLSGIPVYREGQSFIIPSGHWSVIDECSGVRYLMASFMVGSLFAYLNYRSYRRRVVFMAVSLAVPVLANWVRAYLIVMMAHLSGNRLATGVDHILYGWVFFGLIIFMMFAGGARWSQPDEAPPDARRSRAAHAAAATRGVVAAAMLGGAITVLPLLTVALLQRAEGEAAPARLALPAQLGPGWSADGARISAWTPEAINPSAETSRAYAGPEGTVGVHLAYYRGQSDERKLVNSANLLVRMRDPDWAIPVTRGQREVDVGGHALAWRTTEILGRVSLGAASQPHLVVWQAYWVDGRFVVGDVAAKIAGALARLRGRGDEGASVILYADGATVDASNRALQAFVQANADRLGALLQRTRDAR